MKRPLISVIVNVCDLDDLGSLTRCLESVQNFAEEIVIVDMRSSEGVGRIAEGFGAKVFTHRHLHYVEPARNFGISKAKGKWILILDPDEKITKALARRLKLVVSSKKNFDCVLVPRKNIILGKWMENARWWPDYLPRFFRKGKIVWPKEIHQQPNLNDKLIYTLPDSEAAAIVHYNYESLDQYLDRSKRYAEVRAKDLIRDKNYQLSGKDLVLRPLSEFLSRFFVGEAYKDGFHGLALSLLQAWDTLLVYLKVWEFQKYEKKALETSKVKDIFKETVYQLQYWVVDYRLKTSGKTPLLFLKKTFLKLLLKLLERF